MTEDQKYEIAVLAEDYENKRMWFECLGYLNTQGKTAEELAKMSIDYQIADAEKRVSWKKLEAAKDRIVVDSMR